MTTIQPTIVFSPFTQTDWDAFAGCHAAEPLIHYTESQPGRDDCVVIIDGDVVYLIVVENEGEQNMAEYRSRRTNDAYEFAMYVVRGLRYCPRGRLQQFIEVAFADDKFAFPDNA